MRKFLTSCLLLLMTAFYANTASATHLMGADLQYECLGPGQYKVKLQLYRDCNGVSIGSSHTINYSSAQCGVTSSITVTQISVSDITPVCQSQAANTACGGNGQYGVEKYVYEGILNLPPGCGTDWVLSWTNCCRNNAITNLQSPGNENMTIATCGLNNTISPCNNSPAFLNDPVPFFCVNQQVNYNHGVIDIDGDSLVFSSAIPLSGNLGVVYKNPFSANNPFAVSAGGPFSVDPVNGDVQFTPNQQQIGVMAIRVDEYRNGVLIGCVVRDMQFTIINCNNNLPTASGVNGSNNYTLTLPACADTCFTITTADADAADLLTLTANSGIPGATFTSSGGARPNGTFCWTTTANDIGTNTFTVQVKDNACPIIGSNIYSYTINVVPSPDPPVNAGPDVQLCPGQTATLSATVVGGNPIGYSWSDGVNTVNQQSITVNPASTTLYTITAFYASGCEKTDAVLVTRIPKPLVSVFPANITLCTGGSVNIISTTAAPNPSYSWTPTAGLSCTTCPSPIASPTASTQYCVVVTSNGCPSDPACSQVNTSAPPPPQSCAVIYATANGNGTGTSSSSPTNLAGAIALAQCNNSVIKLAQGTYNLTAPISNITSYTTIEGGYDPVTWVKISAPGATTIFRTAANPDGVPTAPRLVAVYMNSQNYFRFQDITFQTADCPNAAVGEIAMSNYVFHLTNCSDYSFVRCRLISGKGGNGASGVAVGQAGANATSVGSNGANGQVDNDNANVVGGNGGAGAGVGAGTGGTGGANGAAGTAGTVPANPRAGGGGGGGGAGGRAATGGAGGAGSIFGGGGPSGGAGGADADPGNPGANGAGINGANGVQGTNGAAGTFAGGFYIPGIQGAAGGDGQGGSGGSGGGGGGGQNCFFCINGTGNSGGGGGGGGEGGTGGEGGWGGGATIGVYAYNNGANGVFDNCNVFLGTVGLGGTGAAGGAGGLGAAGGVGPSFSTGEIGKGGNGGAGGNSGAGGFGGNGTAGSAALLYLDNGTPIAVQDVAFNLSAQPVINVTNVSCTNRPVTFSSANSGAWDFGVNASPQTSNGASAVTQYTAFGRKDITYAGNSYKGFFSIAIDEGSYIPDIATTAQNFGVDTFIICRGNQADFNAVIPGALSFDWDFGGAVTPNTYVGPTFQNLTGLTFNTAGIFKVRLRISTDCCGWSPYDSIWVLVDQTPVLTFNGVFAFCPGDTIALSASGASSYQWSPPTGLNTATGPSVLASPSATTTYLLTGFSQYSFCNVDTVLTLSLTNPPALTFTPLPATCGDNGLITVNPNPAGNYSFLWSDDNNQTTQTATSLPPGTYSVTVTDNASSCSATDGAALSSGTGVQSFIDSSANVTCFGLCNGVARVRGLLGSGNYTYAWSNGATTALISGLCAGTYDVTVTEVPQGCTVESSVTISQPPLLELELLLSDSATCSTTPDGLLVVNAFGGTGPYEYAWNDPALQAGDSAVNLLPGAYTVITVDNLGCTATLTANVYSPPATTNLTFVATPVICFGGSDGEIDITIIGNAAPYTISWNTPNGDVTEDVSNLPFGYYSVQVVDTNNCAAAGGDSILVNQPTQLAIDTNVVDISCFGQTDGSITLVISGATPPYSNPTWNGGSSANPFTGLLAGSYSVTVSDANNCTTAVNNIPIVEPPVLTVNPVATDVTCPGFNDGTVTANAAGGTPSYTYQWNPSVGTTSVISQLAPAQYSVTATDSRNCTASGTATVIELPGIQLSGTPSNVLCYPLQNGFVNLSAVSNFPPTSYVWSNGATSEDIFGLAAGVYSVTITDQNNCVVDTTFEIFNDDAFVISATPSLSNIDLGESVQLNVSASGGNVASVLWLPANGLDCTDCVSPTSSPLQTIDYGVTVTSDSGCVAFDSVRIIVTPRYEIFIPNGFTPNGDGANDYFSVYGNKGSWKQFQVTIFNRLGEKVYESTDPNFQWDGTFKGKPLNPAVFVYLVNIVFLDNYVPEIYKGSVTLVK